MKALRVCTITLILLAFFACNTRRGPVVDERSDGDIQGTLEVNHGKFKEGEIIEVTFTIENISNETVLLARDDELIQDIILSSYPKEKQWSDETGEGLRELELEPGESSTIEWVIEGLDTGIHTLVGFWWSSDIREVDVVVVFEYGSALY